MKNRLITLLVFCTVVTNMMAQKSKEPATRSMMLAVDLPSGALRDNGVFSAAAAKSVLEMLASPEQVLISEVEVLIFTNPSGQKEIAMKLIEEFKNSISQSGYGLTTAVNDASYSWLSKDRSVFLLYTSSTKKESNAYIGSANQLPRYLQQRQEIVQVQPATLSGSEPSNTTPNINEGIYQPNTPSSNSSVHSQSELVGNWGTLAGAKVNWRDESTGNMLVSGVSKGYGLELQADGTFLQSTVVTSGRPSYRVFVSTTGTWEVQKDQIIFHPVDRHYRKWENEIIMTDEHSIPETYEMIWQIKISEISGKQCLYTRYETDKNFNELCKE